MYLFIWLQYVIREQLKAFHAFLWQFCSLKWNLTFARVTKRHGLKRDMLLWNVTKIAFTGITFQYTNQNRSRKLYRNNYFLLFSPESISDRIGRSLPLFIIHVLMFYYNIICYIGTLTHDDSFMHVHAYNMWHQTFIFTKVNRSLM